MKVGSWKVGGWFLTRGDFCFVTSNLGEMLRFRMGDGAAGFEIVAQ